MRINVQIKKTRCGIEKGPTCAQFIFTKGTTPNAKGKQLSKIDANTTYP